MSIDSVAALRAAIAEGLTPKYVFFWGHTPKGEGVDKSCLSQWFEAPFEVDGLVYPTAEHWMMAGKARQFGDEENLAKILAAKTPGEAKALGRQVRGFDRAVWEAARFDLVTEGNVNKFGAHPGLKAYLLGTGARVLVEASPQDRIWGIGWAEHDAAAGDPARWQGLNLLGFALMAARAQLAAG